mmetsp:Transcript_129736/g.252747  ORF Transcript_129736/g.252747 Transcript_129736/m.252747 type:complete len:571 (-) Transcript_129736:319-2031(-)
MARELRCNPLRLFAYFVVAKCEPFLSADVVTRSQRQLDSSHPYNEKCRAIAMRILQIPAVKSYDQCFHDLVAENSGHDWSIPGSEVAAQVECWCKHDLTNTVKTAGCCDHGDYRPMCETDCQPDCSSSLATTCIQDCPSMCLEAAEYMLDANLCRRCNWGRCWPVIKCLTSHARKRVDNNTLARTCHESDFIHEAKLEKYWKCWKHIPKHTSHWNELSSLVHCVCREGMVEVTRNTHCCDSVRYGWGVCTLQCQSEETCVTPEAQTCIHSCQRKCPAYSAVISEQCMRDCFSDESPCKKYLSCRPPSVATHVCDDGRWPEAASGCCVANDTKMLGCPKLCETRRLWRLDRAEAIPWWTRYNKEKGVIAQCTCMDCPETQQESFEKLKRTLAESIWDNGQVMLTDIARRANMTFGPNRKMQELMVRRNSEILKALDAYGDNADTQIAGINDRYSVLITEAAELGEDPGMGRSTVMKIMTKGSSKGDSSIPIIAIVVAASSVAVICTIACASMFLVRMWKKTRQKTPVQPFQQGSQIVIGNPVTQGTAAEVTTGAPVAVAAPTRTKSGSNGK